MQEQQFALVVEADKKSSVVSVLNEAFASLHDSHMQVQVLVHHAGRVPCLKVANLFDSPSGDRRQWSRLMV
jgi:hypothetical protein